MKGQTPGALCLNQHIKTKKSESPSGLCISLFVCLYLSLMSCTLFSFTRKRKVSISPFK